ncbi:MAG: hypothetical protein ACYTAF_04265 [Planctomycetota bacterium]|jgi:hypothetical protein
MNRRGNAACSIGLLLLTAYLAQGCNSTPHVRKPQTPPPPEKAAAEDKPEESFWKRTVSAEAGPRLICEMGLLVLASCEQDLRAEPTAETRKRLREKLPRAKEYLIIGLLRLEKIVVSSGTSCNVARYVRALKIIRMLLMQLEWSDE